MRSNDLDAIAKTARQIVREAGALARKNDPGRGKHEIIRKKAYGDLVTQGDLDVENYILERIGASFPGHGFVSEERGGEVGASEFLWILDPIDGTKYYSRDLPFYAISLALKIAGEPALGIVYGPELDMFFAASAGAGATLNGNGIRCSGADTLDDSYLCVEIPSRYSSEEEMSSGMELMRKLIDRAMRVRIIGVSSLSLCFSAMSAFDGYVNLGSSWKEWDIAGGRVIAVESGMKFSIAGRRIVAGPPSLHEQLAELIVP